MQALPDIDSPPSAGWTRRPRRGGAAATIRHASTTAAGCAILAVVAITPLDLRSQAALAACTVLIAAVVRRIRGGAARLVLVFLSVAATSRYLWWRLSSTVSPAWTIDALLGFVLLAAELYSSAMLVLAYVQSVAPLPRRVVPLPPDRARWPSVDVLIPTYNEPLEVVRATVLAAIALDWPRDRLRIHLLDDGRRAAFRAFAKEAGVDYRVRPDNAHAKAGNLNHALGVTRGEFVAIFDCDHIPTRSFLQVTMGGFLRDPRLALVQTPHHFYSADPITRNLGLPPRVPSENELFYGAIQRGIDTWNASFFCGSCAVLRRAALRDVGGIAVETVTEDAHTALKMHRRGWRSAYVDIPQAAGLATETLSAHVGQRIRWARGMAQLFRIDNPLSGPGLTFAQRISYFTAMLHFFSGIPRLVFLAAPIAYLLFDRHIFNALPAAAVVYGFPHLIHATTANTRLHGRYRHSYWSEVYETILAWYTSIPTAIALVSPSSGSFNVTAKGGRVDDPFFDAAIARPYLILAGLNLAALCGAGWRAWNGGSQPDALAINVVWAVHNLVILSAALAAACERRQRRASPRIPARLPLALRLADGSSLACHTVDVSRGGVRVEMPWRAGPQRARSGLGVTFTDGHGGGDPLPAFVVSDQGSTVQLRFAPLALSQEARLVHAVFSRPDAWAHARDALRVEVPAVTLARIAARGFAGVGRAVAEGFHSAATPRRRVAVAARSRS